MLGIVFTEWYSGNIVYLLRVVYDGRNFGNFYKFRENILSVDYYIRGFVGVVNF